MTIVHCSRISEGLVQAYDMVEIRKPVSMKRRDNSGGIYAGGEKKEIDWISKVRRKWGDSRSSCNNRD